MANNPYEPNVATAGNPYEPSSKGSTNPYDPDVMSTKPQVESATIPELDEASKAKPFYEDILDALDYAGNASRSFIVGAKTKRGALPLLSQALKGNLKTSVGDFKTAFNVPTFDKGEGFDSGDVKDVAIDLGIGIATDPLSYVSGGISGLSKLFGVGKSLGKAGGIAQQAVKTIGKDTPENIAKLASRTAKVKTATQATVGGLVGAGASGPIREGDEYTDTETMNDIVKKIMYTAGGAFAGPAIAAGGKYALGKLRKGTDAIYDDYIKKSRGFEKASEIAEIAKPALDKVNAIARSIVARREKSLQGLSPSEQVLTGEIMHQHKNIATGARNQMLKEEYRKTVAEVGEKFSEEDFHKMIKQLDLESYDVNKIKNYVPESLFYEITEKANKVAVDAFETNSQQLSDRVIDAVGKLREANRKIISDYNLVQKADTVGLEFHIDDVYRKQLKDVYDVVGKGARKSEYIPFNMAKGTGYTSKGEIYNPFNLPAHKAFSDDSKFNKIEELRAALDNSVAGRRKQLAEELSYIKNNIRNNKGIRNSMSDKARARAQADIDSLKNEAISAADPIAKSIETTSEGLRKSYEMYAKNTAYKHLPEFERAAIDDFFKIRNAPVGKATAMVERGLKNFDRFNSWMKVNMLGASTTWLRTNYFDNLTRVYVEEGIIPAAVMSVKSAPLINRLSKIGRDVIEHTSPSRKGLADITNDMMLDASNRGIISNKMFDDIMRPDNNAVEMLYRGLSKSGVKEARDIFGTMARPVTAFLEHTTMRMGQNMEAIARLRTYNNNIKFIKETFKNLTDDQVRDVAADITKKVFFDYNKVTEFERAVMKRAFPFWSFYSKNLPYWLDKISTPVGVSRLSKIEKARRAVGEEPTAEQREEMGDYQMGAGPRAVEPNRYVSFPYQSHLDAFRSIAPMDVAGMITEKLSPAIKTPVELLTNKDMFTGGKLYPSTNINESGDIVPIPKFGGSRWGMATGLVKEPEPGRLETSSNLFQGGEKIVNTLVPNMLGTIPLYRTINRLRRGGNPVLLDPATYLPISEFEISPEAAEFQRKRKQMKKYVGE